MSPASLHAAVAPRRGVSIRMVLAPVELIAAVAVSAVSA